MIMVALVMTVHQKKLIMPSNLPCIKFGHEAHHHIVACHHRCITIIGWMRIPPEYENPSFENKICVTLVRISIVDAVKPYPDYNNRQLLSIWPVSSDIADSSVRFMYGPIISVATGIRRIFNAVKSKAYNLIAPCYDGCC